MESPEPVQNEVLRRAENRKRRLLERSEERMNKIMGVKPESISVHAAVPESPDRPESAIVETAPVPNFVPVIRQEDPEDVDAFDASDPTEDVNDDDEQPLFHTFPRKVSLISTPMDFRQSSPRNKRFPFMTALWWSDANVVDSLSTGALLLTAFVFSIFGVNFFVPFLLAQSFKHTLIYLTASNKPKSFIMSKAFVFETLGELILFLFIYVITQATLV